MFLKPVLFVDDVFFFPFLKSYSRSRHELAVWRLVLALWSPKFGAGPQGELQIGTQDHGLANEFARRLAVSEWLETVVEHEIKNKLTITENLRNVFLNLTGNQRCVKSYLSFSLSHPSTTTNILNTNRKSYMMEFLDVYVCVHQVFF